MKKEGSSSVVFYYLTGLIREVAFGGSVLITSWASHEEGGEQFSSILLSHWPDKRGGLCWECPFKRGTIVYCFTE